MFKNCVFITALLATSVNAFAPAAVNSVQSNVVSTRIAASPFDTPEVDATGNNVVVKDLLSNMQNTGFLTQVANSGLLSKAQEAGVSLSSLEPFLALAAENPDILVLVEAAGPDILPLLPTIVETTPSLLPLLALGVGIKPATLQALGLAAAAGAGASVVLIPDNTLVEVAGQTLLAASLAGAAGAAFVGSAALSNPVAAAKKAVAFL